MVTRLGSTGLRVKALQTVYAKVQSPGFAFKIYFWVLCGGKPVWLVSEGTRPFPQIYGGAPERFLKL